MSKRYSVVFISVLASLLSCQLFGWREKALAQRRTQTQQCDPELKKKDNDPFGYRIIDGRCEGVYVREVGSTSLHVASFVETFAHVDLSAGKNVVITWKSPGGEAVHLRAEVMRSELSYQMDTVRPGSSASYSWPTDKLTQFAVKDAELGIVARIAYAMSNTSHDVYLPIRVSQNSRSAQSSTFKVTVLPGAELSRVFVSLAPIVNGQKGTFIMRDQRVNGNYFPAQQRIDIDIKKPSTPGIYFVQIGARLRAGGSASTELWFYNPG